MLKTVSRRSNCAGSSARAAHTCDITLTSHVASHSASGASGPPGGPGTWLLRFPGTGPDLIVEIEPITTEDCDHRFEAKGHDPGAKLRHLAQVRHATCTGPVCRRPAASCDYEHNTP